MGNIIRKDAVGRQDQDIGGFQVLAVVIQKIGNSVQGNGGLAASGCALDYHDLIPGVSNDGILLFLDGADNIFQRSAASAAKLCHKNLVINLHITFKLVNHTAISNLVLPLGGNFTADGSQRCLIRRRTFIIVVEKPADRSTPVIDQRRMPCLFCEISDSNIKDLRLLIPFKYEIHSSKERGIQHFTKSFSQMDLLLVGVDLVKKCLLVIEIFVTILVHLRIVLPVILMHSFDILLSFQNGLADMGDPGF